MRRNRNRMFKEKKEVVDSMENTSMFGNVSGFKSI
jgi:hypothetical protein